MMNIRFKYITAFFFTAISGIALADGDCRNLNTYISKAKQTAENMLSNRFTTEHEGGREYNVAVDEVVEFLEKLNKEVGEKRAACAVIASSRARAILSYAVKEKSNERFASDLQRNIDEVKKCLVLHSPTLETTEQIYKYESDAYYTCKGVLKP